MKTTAPGCVALSALATATLMMHHPDKGRDVPDSRYPADIALDLVGVHMNGKHMEDASSFGLGFAMGLELGAVLAVDPLHCPNINNLVSKYEELVRKTYIECTAAA